MIAADLLDRRRSEIAGSADLSALLARLTERAAPVLDRMPAIPEVKALLSADGGVCPRDGTTLLFDPWSPTVHRCPRCGSEHTGDRHHRAWARHQHLWLAERAAHLAAVAVLGERPDAAARAESLLSHYGRSYRDYPNRDNVLGPARLFFSTYLESIWLCNYLAAATLLRDAGMLAEDAAEGVSAVADDAANSIGEFDEGFSNRQTWHNAALAAVAVWFDDAELGQSIVERETGMIAHLVHGFGRDGTWYEGENYHLFALRGQLVAMGWAQLAGIDLLADARLANILEAALAAPTLTALPDFTFPARKDSRFGISLAQPMYLELWEVGLARLARLARLVRDDSPLWSWLQDVTASAAPPAEPFDSYLHEAGEPAPLHPRTRADLSWWALLEMRPELPVSAPAWTPASVLLPGQGLAVLRHGERYVSLESGAYGGGHGHPDRLHLTVHAERVHWLPDFGTGSYVARDLFWYRSTLAHNAPRLDGVSQPPGDAVCEFFDAAGDWAWARGSYGDLRRTVVAAPGYVLDVVELNGGDEHLLELPWHFAGRTEVLTPGAWLPDQLSSEFVTETERLDTPISTDTTYLIRATAERHDHPVFLSAHIAAPAQLLRAKAPGAPGTGAPATFYVLRARGRNARYVTVLESHAAEPAIRGLRVTGDLIEVETAAGVHRHTASLDGWEIHTPSAELKLRGRQESIKAKFTPLFRDRRQPIEAAATPLTEPPPLDGTLDGFAADQPLTLDYDDQYRRGEEPYPGPDELAATAYVNWTEEALYLAVDVVKPTVVFRPPDAEPLRLDNEPDDIHSDGVQVYLRIADDLPVYGFLVVPADETGAIRARGVAGTSAGAEMVHGRWSRTDSGYCMTIAITIPEWTHVRPGDRIAFDLLVNQMEPDRLRRAGQLVWSGGGGWIWLRGDRQDPTNFGLLTLE